MQLKKAKEMCPGDTARSLDQSLWLQTSLQQFVLHHRTQHSFHAAFRTQWNSMLASAMGDGFLPCRANTNREEQC